MRILGGKKLDQKTKKQKEKKKKRKQDRHRKPEGAAGSGQRTGRHQ
jgi:hypothetical protein